jgi:hypothetical protein
MVFPRNLKPWSLLSRVFESSEAAFVAWVGELRMICVRLPPHYTELEEGLAELADAPLATWHAGSGRTGIGTVVAPISEAFLRAAASADRVRTDGSPRRIRERLAEGPYWVAPLAKRQVFSLERLRIGRSADNDLVLRHASVSKNHAFIEYDDRALFYVCDEGSTNGTQINGRTLTPGELEVLEAGDTLRFGDVECLLIDAAVFWQALHTDDSDS